MENKNYWLSLKPHVYVKFEENSILLYDTKKGNYIESLNPEVISLINEIYEPENLGVTILENEKINIQIKDFVDELLDNQMADILDVEKTKTKPVRLIPILNLQKDIDKLKKNNEQFIGEDVFNYLLELNIYLNEYCDQSCKSCKEYGKQFNCCSADNNNKEELPIDSLNALFKQIQYSSVGKINILGGNILKYDSIDELYKILEPLDKMVHFYLHYSNFEKNNDINKFTNLNIIVNFPVNEVKLNDVISNINHEKTTIHFIIEDEEQFNDAEVLINNLDIKKYTIHPFYNGSNINFFEENIFLTKDDVFSNTLSMREIFRNQKLNSNYFGSLFIQPDGTVKASMNTQAIGNIKTDKILNILYNEMTENTAWRQVRDSEPCDKCLYQYLCPAPSNYEKVINRPNLCNVVVQ